MGKAGAAAALLWVTGMLHAADLRIMTFNIKNGGDKADWNNRKAQVFNVFRTYAPDVAGLQEVFKYQLDELLAALPDYAAVGVGRDDGKTAGEYSPILYRKTVFQVDTSATFWLSSTPEVPGSKVPGAGNPRIDTWARLRHSATGKMLYFHSTHWDNVSAEARLLAAKLMAQRIVDRKYKQEPVIAVCDCNAWAEEEPVKYLLGSPGTAGSPLSFYSAYETLHPGEAASATFNDFKGDTLGKPIDHIMTFDTIPALSARIVRDHIGSQYPSDHYPLMATLRLTTPVAVLDRRRGVGADGRTPDVDANGRRWPADRPGNGIRLGSEAGGPSRNGAATTDNPGPR
jgi:endonuclease/exonuclease/phosphatase family metal-dependent hydrolase